MSAETLFAHLGGIVPVQSDTFRPMPEADICELETRLACHFPLDYRNFLATFGASTFNGASEDHPYVVFRSLKPLPAHITTTDLAMFDAFFGADHGQRNAYSLRTRIDFYAGRMPASMMPIATDGGAGLICLGVKNDDAGKIFYWDQQNEPLSEDEYQEDYEEPRPPQAMYQNVHLVATSFANFLKQLQLLKQE